MIYEFEGKTERDAIDKAIAELGVESDQFDVEIVEIQKNSLFKKGREVRFRYAPPTGAGTRCSYG